ncbi:histamine H2 receptor-like [Porites lutea]|uniref:histamine H2 receptor-like n=1 Tax=Porites lutea TaxID=51062 RepID=UPI003CC5B90B
MENANSCFLPMAHGIALITINAIVCVLGSLGNLLVCLAIATNFRLRRASNYLLFSLAIADLIVTLICEPLLMEAIIQRIFLYDCTASLCMAYNFLSYLSCATSVLHMVAISLDRFVAVAFPLRHKHFMEKCGLKVMLIVSWSIPIFEVILLLVLWLVIPKASYSVAKFLFLGTFFFSYLLIFFFYFLIVTFLLHHKKTRKRLRAGNVSVKLTSRMEVRVSCTLAIAIGIFTACWAPAIASMFADTMIGKPLIRLDSPWAIWLETLALSNSALNFLIYSAKIRDFKEAYVDIFRKMLRL